MDKYQISVGSGLAEQPVRDVPGTRVTDTNKSQYMAIEHENDGERPESRLLQCTDCEKLYPARITADDRLAPMNTNCCTNCGSEQFVQVVLGDS